MRAKIYRNCFQLLYFFYVFSPAGGKTEVTRSQKLEKPCPAGGLGVTSMVLERSRRGHRGAGEVTAEAQGRSRNPPAANERRMLPAKRQPAQARPWRTSEGCPWRSSNRRKCAHGERAQGCPWRSSNRRRDAKGASPPVANERRMSLAKQQPAQVRPRRTSEGCPLRRPATGAGTLRAQARPWRTSAGMPMAKQQPAQGR